MAPTWDPNKYDDNKIVREFVRELNALVEEYSRYVERFEGRTCIAIKDRTSKKKLIEYWPIQNKIMNTESDHTRAGVPQELIREYRSAVTAWG
ncbi:MAG: hypothetical protein ABIN58_01600, partial [candidate division WOR-3 bacterium]